MRQHVIGRLALNAPDRQRDRDPEDADDDALDLRSDRSRFIPVAKNGTNHRSCQEPLFEFGIGPSEGTKRQDEENRARHAGDEDANVAQRNEQEPNREMQRPQVPVTGQFCR